MKAEGRASLCTTAVLLPADKGVVSLFQQGLKLLEEGLLGLSAAGVDGNGGTKKMER